MKKCLAKKSYAGPFKDLDFWEEGLKTAMWFLSQNIFFRVSHFIGKYINFWDPIGTVYISKIDPIYIDNWCQFHSYILYNGTRIYVLAFSFAQNVVWLYLVHTNVWWRSQVVVPAV